MKKSEITDILNKFAPPELAESWDCSGWCVETSKTEIKKIMFCLTVTNDVLVQAQKNNCDMIFSHHPLFYVPLDYNNIDIYCAHTNLDIVEGGTTDTLIDKLNLTSNVILKDGFVRYVDLDISINDFVQKLKTVTTNLRVVNNKNFEKISRIGFCAGSGMEFLQSAFENKADAFVTGDVKFHQAVESKIVIFDIGHFESEIFVLNTVKKLFKDKIEIIFAQESSPFKSFN